MSNDIIINKSRNIKHYLQRITEEYVGHETDFLTNFSRQDSVMLNIQRACEQTIGIANNLVRTKKLGIPQNSGDAFKILATNHIISDDLCTKMCAMIGFRNLIVHQYENVDMQVVVAVLTHELPIFETFLQAIFSFLILHNEL